MSQTQLAECHRRLQRKLAACYEGWHSGRVDRLEEALRAIERQLRTPQGEPPSPSARIHH